MKVNRNIIHDIEDKQLISIRHTQRMPETIPSKQVLEWKPSGRRKQGRLYRRWQDGINEEIAERGIGEDFGNDREEWRLGTRRGGTLSIYIYTVVGSPLRMIFREPDLRKAVLQQQVLHLPIRFHLVFLV
ncbi:hypothetical protein Trydic_g7259 [Trypoxylus dichotomus]